MDCKNLDIFVLTYNRAEYLRIMLDSLCTQTATGFTIKVLNNCSTDNTLDIIQEVQNKYPERKIEVITHEKNLGNFGNFKCSQELAQNEYTAIFHDDDAIHPEYIETAMKIFQENKEVVMCSGNLIGLWNVDNTDWGILDKNYFLYPKEDGLYFNFLLQRPTFASNIYKTEIYKKVQYHPEKYGKLHDVVFMLEINKIGAVAFILGCCIKWQQSPSNDSNTFKNGPFPNEIANIINDIYRLTPKHKFLLKPLLWNFAFFLYRWSELKRYETWTQFKKRLLRKEGGSFRPLELFLFQQKSYIDFFNKLITKRADKYRRKVFKAYDSRF